MSIVRINPSRNASDNSEKLLYGHVLKVPRLPEAFALVEGMAVFNVEDNCFYRCEHITSNGADYYQWNRVTFGAYRPFLVPVGKLTDIDCCEITEKRDVSSLPKTLNEIIFGLRRFEEAQDYIEPLGYKRTTRTKYVSAVAFYGWHWTDISGMETVDGRKAFGGQVEQLISGTTDEVAHGGKYFVTSDTTAQANKIYYVRTVVAGYEKFEVSDITVGEPIAAGSLYEWQIVDYSNGQDIIPGTAYEPNTATVWDSITMIDIVKRINQIAKQLNLHYANIPLMDEDAVASIDEDDVTAVKDTLFRCCNITNKIIDEVNPFSFPWQVLVNRIHAVEVLANAIDNRVGQAKLNEEDASRTKVDLDAWKNHTWLNYDPYKLTTDTTVVAGKKYYTKTGAGTGANPYSYTLIDLPTGSVIETGTYYEKNPLMILKWGNVVQVVEDCLKLLDRQDKQIGNIAWLLEEEGDETTLVDYIKKIADKSMHSVRGLNQVWAALGGEQGFTLIPKKIPDPSDPSAEIANKFEEGVTYYRFDGSVGYFTVLNGGVAITEGVFASGNKYFIPTGTLKFRYLVAGTDYDVGDDIEEWIAAKGTDLYLGTAETMHYITADVEHCSIEQYVVANGHSVYAFVMSAGATTGPFEEPWAGKNTVNARISANVARLNRLDKIVGEALKTIKIETFEATATKASTAVAPYYYYFDTETNMFKTLVVAAGADLDMYRNKVGYGPVFINCNTDPLDIVNQIEQNNILSTRTDAIDWMHYREITDNVTGIHRRIMRMKDLVGINGPKYVVTTDVKYKAAKEYFKLEGTTYTHLTRGVDYKVGMLVTGGNIYEYANESQWMVDGYIACTYPFFKVGESYFKKVGDKYVELVEGTSSEAADGMVRYTPTEDKVARANSTIANPLYYRKLVVEGAVTWQVVEILKGATIKETLYEKSTIDYVIPEYALTTDETFVEGKIYYRYDTNISNYLTLVENEDYAVGATVPANQIYEWNNVTPIDGLGYTVYIRYTVYRENETHRGLIDLDTYDLNKERKQCNQFQEWAKKRFNTLEQYVMEMALLTLDIITQEACTMTLLHERTDKLITVHNALERLSGVQSWKEADDVYQSGFNYFLKIGGIYYTMIENATTRFEYKKAEGTFLPGVMYVMDYEGEWVDLIAESSEWEVSYHVGDDIETWEYEHGYEVYVKHSLGYEVGQPVKENVYTKDIVISTTENYTLNSIRQAINRILRIHLTGELPEYTALPDTTIILETMTYYRYSNGGWEKIIPEEDDPYMIGKTIREYDPEHTWYLHFAEISDAKYYSMTPCRIYLNEMIKLHRNTDNI